MGANSTRFDEDFFRSAVESSADCIGAVDREGRVLFVNKAARAAFDIEDLSAFEGRPWNTFWPWPARQEVDRALAAGLRGETFRFEGECPTRRGEIKWWDVVVSPRLDGDGATTGMVVTCRDITAARLAGLDADVVALDLARTAAASRSASRLAQVGGWEIDFLTGNAFFSPELCELLGVPFLPMKPTSEAVDLWVEEDRARFRSAAEAARHGERLTFEGRSVTLDGSPRWWRLLGEPQFADGRCVALRGVAQDVTEWREAMDRLHASEQTALRASAAMSGFLATMSHEIRTPLNGVLGMAQALVQDELSAPQRQRVEVIRNSGETLLWLLTDLLDLSRIEADRLELEIGVIDAQGLAEAARTAFAVLAHDKALSLEVTLAPSAAGSWVGDAARLRQVLLNLLSNAVKFTERGAVAVEISHDGACMILQVRDTGVGISEDRLAYIFDKFTQGDATTTRRHSGAGLGLTLCRELLALMGGDIQVSSREGAGTTFTVRLPLVAAEAPDPAAQAPEQPPAPAAAERALRVLAAEDNAVNQQVLKALLGAVGIEPVLVGNGQEALDAWRDADWDIVLMDIQMPVMDGPTAVRRMREVERREGRRRTPIIAVTANAMAHHEAEYLAAGLDALVAKPIDLGLLLQAIDTLLQSDEMEGDGDAPARIAG
ncbi:MAG: hybrid sensor histidine kinase/response regulator [Phenylobacterium sp.]|nr:hybrid sensor histidine kinase/response regulator [Phenylobacterium sp.]